MKKLQDNLPARIAASVILTVSFLLTLLSTAGIVLLASYQAYNDGGAQLRTSYLHAAGVQEYYDHVAIAEYLRALYARYGITLTVTAQDMQTFLAERAAGGYSVTRCSFSADLDDPMPFLSLWASGAGSNFVALGRGAHMDYAGYTVTIDGRTKDGCTWAESYDALLYRIASSSDTAERYALMHQAETLLMQTGAVCPLYWYTDQYLCNAHVQGLLSGPLGAQYLMAAQVQK